MVRNWGRQNCASGKYHDPPQLAASPQKNQRPTIAWTINWSVVVEAQIRLLPDLNRAASIFAVSESMWRTGHSEEDQTAITILFSSSR